MWAWVSVSVYVGEHVNELLRRAGHHSISNWAHAIEGKNKKRMDKKEWKEEATRSEAEAE